MLASSQRTKAKYQQLNKLKRSLIASTFYDLAAETEA